MSDHAAAPAGAAVPSRFLQGHFRSMAEQLDAATDKLAQQMAAKPRSGVQATKRRLNEIYVKHTGQPYEKIERTLDRDFFMTADEARTFGIVDRVYEKRELPEGAA